MVYSKQQDSLLQKFSQSSDNLFNLGVITTDSFTGEIGEFVACKVFNLEKTKRVTKAVDGISQRGEKYQIKAKIITKGYNYTIENLENKLIDFLVIVYFDYLYTLKKILRIPSEKIKNNQITIKASNINSFEEIPISNFNPSPQIKKAINNFAVAYHELVEQKIIRSRRIVGDIGEYYASQRLQLLLSENKTEKGIDARHPNGFTFEIKTRRVYSSGRRISETRRINNLVGKLADFLIVVTLDKSFKCSGMWIMPTKNIINPKSAHLKIVNTTPGTLNLVPSKISWLETGEKFNNFTQLTKISKKIHSRKELLEFGGKTQQKTEIKKVIEIQNEFDRQSKELEKGCLTIVFIVIAFLLILALIGSIL